MNKLLLLLLLPPLGVVAQKHENLGIGVITIIYPKTSIKFYSDTVTKTIRYDVVFSTKEKLFEDLLKSNKLMPVQSTVVDEWGNIKLFDLICLKAGKNWYKVKMNLESNESYWLHDDGSFSFNEWEPHLTSMLCISRKDTTNKIYRANNSKSEVIPFKGYECFKALEIKD